MKRSPLTRFTPLRSRSRLPRRTWVPSLAPRAPSPPRRDTGFPRSVRQLVADRAAGWCEKCGQRAWTQQHHRRGRAMGSTRRPDTNQPQNALALCTSCHAWVESNRTVSLVHGWAVNQSHDPGAVPVLLHHGWVRLTPDGRFTPHTPTKESA